MQNWNAYREALVARVGDFAALNPEAMRGLQTIDSGSVKMGKLEPKIHELIALAVAVTTRCDGCISIHAQKAIELGASRDEVAEALGTAIALNAGAALVYTSRVFDAIDSLPK
ncbi:carboxymuconolactone decarboxylase family protein [Acetobacter orleanensis]|nr:carboxymuconolactone decarboxylase family protein [Acetobacter orleanensis]KXV67082.1 alkylhydroperoxidase [Acetobacter orleanensis]PCD78289.1 carboxymuconolactone decarboxylase family protein [Acetobacter orleanensis]